MNYTQEIMIKILSSAIHKRKFELSECDDVEKIDFNEMLMLSQEHNVTALLYYALSGTKSLSLIPSDILEQMKKLTFLRSSYQMSHVKNVTEILSKFKENDIKTVVLKGLVVRNFYPRPEFRTMSDADIVVQEQDLDAAINLITSLGYVEKVRTHADICYIKGNSVIELHWKLINPGRINGGENFENEIWDDLIEVNVGESHALSLNYEDLAVHLCVHLIKHLANKGCGIRMFCDLVVLFEQKEDEINWDSFWSKIRQYNVEKAVRIILYICSEYLGIEIKTEMDNEKYIDKKYLDMLLTDVMNHGVFGKSKEGEEIARAVVFDADKDSEKSDFVKYFRVFFPSVKDLVISYPYADKYRVLVPVAYIHRLGKWTFNKDIKTADKVNFCIKGMSVIKERAPIMKWMEL
ncbi:MAG: nucleotidyltransferase family protein [Clostridium saudiense]|uniref:nucleotidyltransferase domain-containing protein n=1 Tax=Clostridium saudiense TaxID=1414720 RepID=UPI0018A8E88A|nr:nucleotidyltransferase family protein [Clostridium saudiense]